MAAIAVLSILVLMFASMMSSTSATVFSGNKHLTADDQARLVLDRIQMDLARMPKRSDLYFQFLKQTGNDELTFYSETPGFFAGGTAAASESNLSLVSYQYTNTYELERLGQGCEWTDSNVAFSPTPTTAPTLNSSDFHLLSSSVFRLEIGFLIRQDATHLQITATAPTPGSQAFQNFVAVVVAIAVLDPQSEAMVNTNSYSTLIAALPDFPSPTIPSPQTISLASTNAPNSGITDPIMSNWNYIVNQPTTFAQSAGIPVVAAQQVRLYERIIYLQ